MTLSGKGLQFARLYGVQSFAADVMGMSLSDPQQTLLDVLEDRILNGVADEFPMPDVFVSKAYRNEKFSYSLDWTRPIHCGSTTPNKCKVDTKATAKRRAANKAARKARKNK